MSKVKSSAKATGNASVDSELRRLWDAVNKLSEQMDNINVGERSPEGGSGFRFVESGDSLKIEAKFKNGWAQLPIDFVLKDKKD